MRPLTPLGYVLETCLNSIKRGHFLFAKMRIQTIFGQVWLLNSFRLPSAANLRQLICLFPPQAAADSLSLKEGGFILLPLLLIPKASLPEGGAERSEAEGVILPAPAAPRRPSSIRKAQSPKCSPAPPPHAAQCTDRAARQSPKQRSRVWRCQSSAAPARWRAWA